MMSPSREYFNFPLPEGHEKALKQAFYNTAASLCVVLFCCASVAVYYILESFLRPLLWAVLCGSFLHPFKHAISGYTHGWLRSLLDDGTPLAVGVFLIPVRIVDNVTEVLYVQASTHYKLLAAFLTGLPCLYVLLHSGYVYSIFTVVQVFYVICYDIMGYLKGTWVCAIVAAYITSVYFLWSPESSRTLRLIAIPVWGVVLLYLAGIAGALRVPLLFMITALFVVGYSAKRKEKTEEKPPSTTEETVTEDEATFKSTTDEIKPDEIPPAGVEQVDKEKPSTTEAGRSADETDGGADKSLSDLCFIGLAWALVLVMVWKNLWILQLLPIMILLLAAKKIGYSLGLWSKLQTWTQSMYIGIKSRVQSDPRFDVMGTKSIRGVAYLVSKGDRKVVKILFESVNKFMSITIILLLLFGAVFSLIFSAVQVHKESMYLVTFTSNLFNSSLHPEMSEWLPDNVEMTEAIDSMADNAYVYGREWIAGKVESMFASDQKNNEDVKRQVLHVWDQLYHSWFGKNTTESSSHPHHAHVALQRQNSIMDINLYDLVQNTDFSLNIVAFLQENVGILMSVLESVWLVLRGNIALCFSLLTAAISMVLGGGTALLNFLLSFVIFITTLFYLLCASGDTYKPVEWLSSLSPGPSQGGSKLGKAVEEAVSSVFLASIKMSIFYGLYTWLTHTAFDINIVFIPSALAAVFAAIPFVGAYWAALPGIIELWLVNGQPVSAVVLLVISMLPAYVVDTAIYSDIKGGHPYLTGLAITGGMFWLGLEGAIIGPMVLCCMVVAMNVYTTMMQPDPKSPTKKVHYMRAQSSSV